MTRFAEGKSRGILMIAAAAVLSLPLEAPGEAKLRVGAFAINMRCTPEMVLAGMLDGRFTDQQEGELRAVAIVVENPSAVESPGSPDSRKLAIVGCDVLWVPRDLADAACDEIHRQTGIPPRNILINASHTHHAPSPAGAHNFGVSSPFRAELTSAIVRSVVDANRSLSKELCVPHFHLGEEKTIGANSRLRLPNQNITWMNPLKEAKESGPAPEPTGPFDPQLPVLDFRTEAGRSVALLFNHSTHTIGTRNNANVRSPSFYGLAAQEMERESQAIVAFLEGASGSTHNIAQIPVDECIVRLKRAIAESQRQAKPLHSARLASIRRPFAFRMRHFDEAVEDAKVLRYTMRYAPQHTDFIRDIFAAMRRQLAPLQGRERVTWVQAMRIGEIAIVGAPAEYFTALGLDIKKRSPFPHTIVAELANDWVGYLPDRKGHADGGYQTWTGLHSYAEPGTGERVADALVEMLEELADKRPHRPSNTFDKPGPKSPAEELTRFRLADPQLEIELVAAEPDVVSPVSCAWDADGRMFVVEMHGYPETPNQCRIVMLQDRDGDGHYEKRTVFADRLSFPTSVLPYGRGVLAAAAPDILYLEDSSGDGNADIRRTVWTGFGEGSQQLRANGLHYGIDNWIYGANGRCDGEIRRPEQKPDQAVSIRARDFRFRPDLSAFEAITGQSQYGLAHDDWGNRFLSWNTIPLRHAAIEARYLAFGPEMSSLAVVDLTPVDDDRKVWSIAALPRQFNAEPADRYNAMCGLTIFRGNALGSEYAGNAFIAESLAGVVTRRQVTPDGPTFVSRRVETDREFLASTDGWFHPVFVTCGPDGAMYVVDFYREFVEHPIYVASESLRKEIDWRSGAGHGRIWRIRRADFGRSRTLLNKPVPPPRLSEMKADELVKRLDHPVGWQRDTAQRLLVERGDDSVVDALREIAFNGNNATARLHAYWTLEGLRRMDAELLCKALSDADPRVRRSVLKLVESTGASDQKLAETFARLVEDPDAGVRFQWALTARSIGFAQRLDLLAGMLDADNEGNALMTASAILAASDAPHELAFILAGRNPAWLKSPTNSQFAFLAMLGRAIARDVAPESQKAFLHSLETRHGADTHPGAAALMAGWLDGTTEKGRSPREAWSGFEASSVFAAAAAAAIDESADPIRRKAAIRCLAFADAKLASGPLARLLQDRRTELVSAAAAALADRGDTELCRLAYSEWRLRPQRSRNAILTAGIRSRAAAAALIDAMEKQVVLAAELPLDLESALANPKVVGAELAQRFGHLRSSAHSEDRQSIVESYRKAIDMTGDAVKGAAVFREHCLTCHAIAGIGNRVGPDLSATASRSKADLLVDILDPSRRASPDYTGYIAVTKSGQVVTGLIAAETADAVTLRQERGVETTIPRNELEELKASRKSLMPDGHEKKIALQDMADLLEFLRKPDRRLVQSGDK